MEIRNWQFYVVFNCALIYCGVAKTFSLNEAIAAESQKQLEQTTISVKLEEHTTERYTLKKSTKPLSILQKRKKVQDSELIASLTKGISPLKYRKTFQIKSPLKPKRLKYLIGTKQKRNNQAIKREINGNDKLKQKHIPLLKSLSMLLDNILGADSGESIEAKPKRKRYYYEGSEETCKCATRSDSSPLSKDKTNSASEPLSSEISVATEASAETPHLTTPSYVLNLRHNKNLPLLFPRNTFSSRRDNNGLRQRNRAPNNRSSKRYITRFNGDSEYNTDSGKDESRTKSDEENTSSTPRYGNGGIRSRNKIRGVRNYTRKTEKIYPNDEESKFKTENTVGDVGRIIDEFERENKLEISRNETESAKLIPEPSRRLRGVVSEDNVGVTSQPEESNEKSELDHSGNQRVADRNGTLTQETKESYEGNETVRSIQIPDFYAKSPRKQGPVVVIIDGYSVTRNKNGENKLSEKAVHIET